MPRRRTIDYPTIGGGFVGGGWDATHEADEESPPEDVALPDVASSTRLLDLQADAGLTTSTASWSGTGTIVQSGTTIFGTDTAFEGEVVVGDRLTSTLSTINGIVTVVTNNFELELDTSAVVDDDPSYTIIPQTDTARVAAFADGLGNVFTASGLARPARMLSGGPYLTFMNTTAWMLGPTGIADNLTSMAVIAVFRRQQNPIIISKIEDNNSDAGWQLTGSSSGDQLYLQDDGDNNQLASRHTSIDNTVFHICYGELTELTDAGITVYVNGDGSNQSHSSSFGTVTDFSTVAPLRLGATGGLVTGSMDLQAAMIYAPAPDAADRAAIEAWLADKYGITL